MPDQRDAEWERQHLYRVFFDYLDMCGCNEPWAAYNLVRDLLNYFAQDHADRDYHDLYRLIGTPGAVHLVLCELDIAALIEHGGTVAGAWLTGKGRRVLELIRRHAWEDAEDGTPGVDQAGYPHDGQDCQDGCWVPQESAPPRLNVVEMQARLRKAVSLERAHMTPGQRARDDQMTELMLTGRTTITRPDGKQLTVIYTQNGPAPVRGAVQALRSAEDDIGAYALNSQRLTAALDATIGANRATCSGLSSEVAQQVREAMDASCHTELMYPQAAGLALSKWLHPPELSEQSGPPWFHKVSGKPCCDLDDCCENARPCGCNCHRVQPSYTVTMLPTERTPAQWCTEYGLEIADPDGWREPPAPAFDQPIGLAQFARRYVRSTVRVGSGDQERFQADVKAARDAE